MFTSILKIIYVVIPLGLFLWFMMDSDSLSATVEYVNSIQGSEGWIVLNGPDSKTWGTATTEWLDANFPGQSPPDPLWIRVGSDLDRAIYTLQNHWAWIVVGMLLAAGIILIMLQRDYS